MISKIAVAATVGIALLAVVGTAQASSIVFVRGGDVWLTTPDRSREYRVTTGGGFGNVTQADDGTIVAGKGGQLYRMDRNGRQLNPPFSVETAGCSSSNVVPVGIDLSPDGTKVAFWALISCGGRAQVQITDSDRPANPTKYAYVEGNSPAWVSNDLLIYTSSNSYVYTTGVAPGTGAEWFSAEPTPDGNFFTLSQAAVTRARDKLVATQVPPFGLQVWSMRFYSANGGPPTGPTPGCLQDFGETQPTRLTWSPAGDGLAWEQSDGIHVAAAPDLGTCAAAPGFVIAGAASPDWGPADVPPPGPVVPPKPDPKLPLADTTAPVAASLKLRPSSIKALSKGPSIVVAGGALVSYAVSEAAALIFTVEQALPGRKAGKKCVRQTKKNKRAKRCTLYRKVKGGFVHQGIAGANSFRFSGRLNNKKLAAGSYRMTGTPIDNAKNTGKPVNASFTIKKK